MTEKKDPHGRRHTRGYLPHFDAPGFTQFVTFRLAGSLPRTIFNSLKFKFVTGKLDEIEYQREIDKALDLGSGPTHLKDARIAAAVAETILKFAGERYDLLAWVIMPNHVHLLFRPYYGYELSAIVHSIKSYTATKANRILGTKGRFWSPDYFDRFIRNRIHLAAARKYVEENPTKAGLCATPSDWRWSSAYRR